MLVGEFVFFTLGLCMLIGVDLLMHKKARDIPLKEAAFLSLFWIGISLVFSLYIFYSRGQEGGIAFLTGYIVEKTLSIDNLFVFLVIFSYFRTPSQLMHQALSYGIIGAIVLRALLILVGVVLIAQFHWVLYIFGGILLVIGIKLFFGKKEKKEPMGEIVATKLLGKLMPITSEYYGGKLFIRKERLYATPLALVILSLEFTDLVFALDSIPAVLVITQDPFIAYTSNVLAVLGLRALFFLIHPMLNMFVYLHKGLAVVLMFIALKMLVRPFYEIPISIALSVIVGILVIAVALSYLKKRIVPK